MQKKIQRKTYKYVPAFILLFLAREKNYGNSLLKLLNLELPCFKTDSALVYRSLQELEYNGFVQSYWETQKSGQPRRWYEITENGLQQLLKHKIDIENRKKNFDYFLTLYDKIK